MKRYSVKEIFYTLQGEGVNAGVPAVFVRFAGCNLWTGKDETRVIDADRNSAECPKWCDTDFRGGEKLTAEGIFARIQTEVPNTNLLPLVVFTGGEPLLQIDRELMDLMTEFLPSTRFALETNGAVQEKDGGLIRFHHICVSPKIDSGQIVIRQGTELKVVYPAYNPLDYSELAPGFKHLYVSPEAETPSVGLSKLTPRNHTQAAKFCMRNPRWRLSIQSHKVIGIP
jgi:7-carboxy-7-deazaguanine synthase